MDEWMPLEPNDVLSSLQGNQKLPAGVESTSTVEAFQSRVEQVLLNRSFGGAPQCLSGFKCRLLKPGDEWKTVSVRVKVEFTVEYQGE